MDKLLADYKHILAQTSSPREVVKIATIFNAVAAQFIKDRFKASERTIANQFRISNTAVAKWREKSQKYQEEEETREHLS